MLKKSKKYRVRRFNLLLTISVLIAFIIITVSLLGNHEKIETTNILNSETSETSVSAEITTESTPETTYPEITPTTVTLSNIDSQYAVLIDAETGNIIASKNCNERIYPASLTKLMTLLVAVEHIENFNDTFTMTNEIIAPLVDEDASRAGFSEKEEVKVIDLLYGTVLPSGADATVGLAEYISGSEEEFVKLMNSKATELGLRDTHFTNTSGLYDSNHYSTATDIALILKATMKNELCRKILSTYQYTTSVTPQHPEGILLTSTMFSRMYGNEVENVEILGGKTGYIEESKHCLASFAEKGGKEYIAVTLMGSSKYKPIFDSFEIYGNYIN